MNILISLILITGAFLIAIGASATAHARSRPLGPPPSLLESLTTPRAVPEAQRRGRIPAELAATAGKFNR